MVCMMAQLGRLALNKQGDEPIETFVDFLIPSPRHQTMHVGPLYDLTFRQKTVFSGFGFAAVRENTVVFCTRSWGTGAR